MKVTVHIDSRATDPGWSMQPPVWREEALCAQVGDDDVWFPPKGGSSDAAKRVCEHCPARRPCLEEAMRVEGQRMVTDTSRDGVWGGLSPRERLALARSGWQAGDPLPPVRLRHHAMGQCGVCGGRYGAALALHQETAHGQAGAA